MLAIVYKRTGPPDEVLELTELPDPEPGPGEVRVRLRSAGINPTDVKARAGHRGRPLAFEYQIPCHDGAGEIDSVGPGVDGARIGQRVWVFHAALGRPAGTSAQYVVVPQDHAVTLGGAPFALGAALGIPFLTAHRCLFRDGAIDGETVLVAGGAGAVGHAAIQLAKRGGARVIATVSSDAKAELARGAGADAVVVGYDRPEAVEEIRAHAPEGVNRIIEVDLGANLDLDRRVIATHGAIATYATGTGDVTLPLSPLIGANVRLDFVLVYLTPAPALAAAARDVEAALEDAAITPLPSRQFSLAESVAAHTFAETSPTGRVLLEIP